MNTEQLWHYAAEATTLLTTRWPKILGGIVTLLVWLWIIKKLSKLVNKGFETAKMDVTVAKFLSSLISVWLKVMLFISVAGMFGIQTTSFIALLWAAGLAIGMALQWSLSNFAGWVLLLIFKPYEVGDMIETEGVFGKVTEIEIFVTKLLTPENKVAIIPNGPIANGNIINYSKQWEIRVDVNIGIAYDEDIDNARTVLSKVIDNHPHTLTTHPGNGVFVNELADSSVNLIVRGYTQPQHYRDVYFGLTEWSKKALDTAGIGIPFPHRVVHTTTDLV